MCVHMYIHSWWKCTWWKGCFDQKEMCMHIRILALRSMAACSVWDHLPTSVSAAISLSCEVMPSRLLPISCLQWNLSIKDTSLTRSLSAVPTTRAVYKSASELGTPLYTGQPTGSQWCPSTIERFHCIQILNANSPHFCVCTHICSYAVRRVTLP